MLQLVLNMDRRRLQRAATVAGFYLAVASLGFLLIAQSINLGSSQLSAYDGGWDDLSTLRDDLNKMGIETRSLVSSPLVLNELDDARNTTLIISGVERNALALPQFDDSGFISFSGSDGYSPSEVDAIRAFVQNGGTVLLLEDLASHPRWQEPSVLRSRIVRPSTESMRRNWTGISCGHACNPHLAATMNSMRPSTRPPCPHTPDGEDRARTHSNTLAPHSMV